MATSTNPMIDNRLIATAMGAQVITVGNTSTTPTIDIPCTGHDAQTNISIDDASGITITSVTVNPLGLSVLLDISAAVAGTYDIVLISGGRNSTELSYPQSSIVITGAAGGVSYGFPFDISAMGKLLGTRPVSTAAPSAGQVPTWNGNVWAPATPTPPVTSVTMGGDVTGNSGSSTVERIRGVNVVATTPTTGQALIYNGTNWAPGNQSVTLAGDVTGSSGANTVTKIQGVAVSNTVPTTGQNLTYNGTVWAPSTPAASYSPRTVKTVTAADFTTVVAGPGGQYQLLWDNALYDAYDLAIDVSGSGDATGIYRVVLPNMTVKADGYTSNRIALLKNKLSGQNVNVRTFNATNDGYMLGSNTSGGSRPTAHLQHGNIVCNILMNRESASNIYMQFVVRELASARNSRTTSISSTTYGVVTGTPYVWGAGNHVNSGESTFSIDVSNQNFSCEGFNRKVLINWRILYSASSGTSWTLDGWLNHSVTGEIAGTRRSISCTSTNGNAVELEGLSEVDWNQLTNGTITLLLFRTGATGNFIRGHIVIKEVL